MTAIVVCVSLALLWSASLARADGDPASDVLTTQSLFLPQDAGVSQLQQSQLTGLLTAAARSGYQARVALIDSSADLGSVTPLWRQPQAYAEFLGQELSLVYRGTLLVVMPNGLGLYNVGSSAAPDRSAITGVKTGSGPALATAALTAIQRLAATAGHPLTVPSAGTVSTSGSGAGSSNPVPLIVFIAGALLIVLTWGASLRARPPRLRSRGV